MTLWLNLAGWHIRLIGASVELAAQAAERYAAFVVSPAAAADLTVEVRPADGERLPQQARSRRSSSADAPCCRHRFALLGASTYLTRQEFMVELH